MTSTPKTVTDSDPNRMFTDAEVEALLGRVYRDGGAVERHSNLISVLSRLLWLRDREKNRTDIVQLEREISTVVDVLDGRPIALQDGDVR